VIEKPVTVQVEKQVAVEKQVIQTVVVAPTAIPTLAPRSLPADAADDQVLRIALEGGLGAGYVPGYAPEERFSSMIYMSLLTFDENLDVQPWLCDKWEANADASVFTMHIDTRARWSDGVPCTAPQAKAWWDWLNLPDQKMQRFTQFDPVKGFKEMASGVAETIEGIEALDDFNLQFTLIRKEGFFPARMALRESAFGRVELFEGKDKADWPNLWERVEQQPVNGPFKPLYIEPEPGAIYRWVQNDNWWGDKRPYIKRIEGTTLRDQQTMLLMFENDELDLTMFISGGPAAVLRKSQPDVFLTIPSAGYNNMILDVTKEPMDDINLRLALLHVIDWEKMAEVAFEGQNPALPGGNLYVEGLPCREDGYLPYSFNVGKAKDYLAKSKYGPTGDKVPKIRVSTAGSDPARIRAAQIVQEYWRVHLGIENVEIKNVESEFGAEASTIQVHTVSGGGALPNAAVWLNTHATERQYRNLDDPKLNAMAEQLLAMDPSNPTYCQLAQEGIRYFHELGTTIGTSRRRIQFQVKPWLKGVKVNNQGVLVNLLDMYIAKH